MTIAALTTWVAGSIGAQASHGADDPTWIAQAGNGQGATKPALRNFLSRTVLFNADSFPLRSGAPRPGGFGKYLSVGTVFATDPVTGGPTAQLAISKSGDGVNWAAPQRATLRDQAGNDLPFLLNDVDDTNAQPSFLDVVYQGREFDNGAFVIWYRIRGGAALSAFAADSSSIHTAVSNDGVTWTSDTTVAQDATVPMVTNTAGPFNAASFGPTDVIYNATGSAACHTAPTASFPWDCRYVMLYDANATGSAPQNVAVGGSGNGTTFRGSAASPLVTPAPGWESSAASLGTLRKVGSGASTTWTLYYGGTDGTSCGAVACYSIGIATATGATPGVFTKAANNPATPRALFEYVTTTGATLGGTPTASLMFTTLTDDRCPAVGCNGDTHSRIYISRVNGSGTGASRDLFIAYTNPAPTSAPSVRISQPRVQAGYRNTRATPLEIFLTDTIGPGPIGIDLNTLVIKVNGLQIGGYQFEDSIVTSLNQPAIRIFNDPNQLQLSDGTNKIEISVKDLNGETSTASTEFVVDTGAPVSAYGGPGSTPASPLVRPVPLDSLGYFSGSSSESFTKLLSVEAVVTNPLGEVKRFKVEDSQIQKLSNTNWSWTWVAPSPDLHFAAPGTYKIQMSARDLAGNIERESSSNTVVLLVV